MVIFPLLYIAWNGDGIFIIKTWKFPSIEVIFLVYSVSWGEWNKHTMCVFDFNILILFSLCYLKQVIPRCIRESIEIINFFFNLRDSCKAENNMRACRRHGSYSTSSCHGEPKGRNPFVVLATRKAQMSFAGTRLHRLSADVSSDPHGSRRNGGLPAIRWRHGCSRSPCHVSRSRWDQGNRW